MMGKVLQLRKSRLSHESLLARCRTAHPSAKQAARLMPRSASCVSKPSSAAAVSGAEGRRVYHHLVTPPTSAEPVSVGAV